MKIVISEGCTAFHTTVDGKLLYGEGNNVMTDEERALLVEHLFVRLREEIKNSAVSINDIIQLFQYDDYEMSEHECDTCGDRIVTTTWEI